jgi:hypothetical protein
MNRPSGCGTSCIPNMKVTWAAMGRFEQESSVKTV